MASKKRRQDPKRAKAIANRLSELMRVGGISVVAMANRLGLGSHSKVSQWIHPKRPTAPNATALWQIAETFGVSVDWLLGLPDASMLRTAGDTTATLDEQLAAYVRGRVIASLRNNNVHLMASDLDVDGDGLLADLWSDASPRIARTMLRQVESAIDAALPRGTSPFERTLREVLAATKALNAEPARARLSKKFKPLPGLARINATAEELELSGWLHVRRGLDELALPTPTRGRPRKKRRTLRPAAR